MPRNYIRTTRDEYKVHTKTHVGWEHLHTLYNDSVAAYNYASEYAKEHKMFTKVTCKRVPNPDVRTVYYVMYNSPEGAKHVGTLSFTVTDAENKLDLMRKSRPMDANRFFVRKSVEYV